MNSIQIATPEDFTAVCGLLRASGLVYNSLTPDPMNGSVVVPADDDPSRLVAVAGMESFPGSSDALLRSVAVAPELRGQGMGRHLVSAIEARATSLGLRRLWLLTTTAPGFFQQLGYGDAVRAEAPAAVQGSSEFQRLCHANAVCLSKTL